MWFNGDKALEKGCLFNFFETIRGAGKTYWLKCKFVRMFLESGKRFIYLRRYDTEIKSQKDFWGQISKEFPDHKLEQNGRDLTIDKKDAGLLIPLSKALTLKSVNYQDVGLIGYDEFQIPKGTYHYLSNEVEAFLDFFETVNRLRLAEDEVIAIFLANRISDYNPYYEYFHIHFRGQNTFRRGEIYAQRPTMEEFRQAKEKTRFGRIIKDTNYGRYNLAGEQMDEYDGKQVASVPAGSFLWTNVVINGVTYGIWGEKKTGYLYVSEKWDSTFPLNFALTRPDAGNKNYLVSRQDRTGKILARTYKLGGVYYENVKIKQFVQPAIARLASA